jgi:hypothetical protein
MKLPPEAMTARETEEVLAHIDRALDVFTRCENRLSSIDIRAKSMLLVLRQEIYGAYTQRALSERDITVAPWPQRR